MSDAMSAGRRSGPAARTALGARVSELTKAQIEELRQTLEERRASLLANIERGREQERDTGREVGDEMDEANIEEEAVVTGKLLERDLALIKEIDRALAKLRDGTYGLCEGTGEPIGYARLRLQPWARYGVEYQEELERRARTSGS